jgi:transcriptional regulator with XRE-family HTH domain
MEKEKRVATAAQRIREAMAACGKKQIDLVNETGLQRSAISRYLSGEYEPKQNAIHKLAVALDVSEMWLWGYDVPRERTPEQKKNDKLSLLVVRLRRDPAFYDVVEKLDQVAPEQLASLGSLLAGLLK